MTKRETNFGRILQMDDMYYKQFEPFWGSWYIKEFIGEANESRSVAETVNIYKSIYGKKKVKKSEFILFINFIVMMIVKLIIVLLELMII